MEWVEVTAKSVEDAKDQALDQLGVDESEAEFEVLEEPKAGLFGRLRSEARVRARVQPTAVRPKVERASRRRGRKDRPDDNGAGRAVPNGGEGGEGGEERASVSNSGSRPPATPRAPRPPRAPHPQRSPRPPAGRREPMNDTQEPSGDVGEMGEEFLRGLITAFGVSGVVSVNELDDGDTIELAVEGDDVGMLIGPRGQTLAAVQEITRTVVQRRADANAPRLVVDVGGYRKARRQALERFTRDVAAQVVETGVVRVLEPMPPADRKVVHDTVNAIDGVSTTSEGEEPRRRVVLTPEASRD